jgi:hypothetical protein
MYAFLSINPQQAAQVITDGRQNMVNIPLVTQICTITSGSYFTRVHRLKFFQEGEFEAAEPHFLASGKRDAARLLAEMFFQWSSSGGSPGAFALRGTIPYV